MRAIDGQRRHDRWIAWHAAMLPNVKRPPSLKDFVGAAREPKPVQTADEIMATMGLWIAHTTGQVPPPAPPNPHPPEPRSIDG